MKYYTLYKPYGMVTQFSGEGMTLADIDFRFPKDVYPVGRLDKDSEGLLLLTNDKRLNHKLLNPKFAHQRTYWVQVEKIPMDEQLLQLRKGLVINLKGKTHKTLPTQVRLFEQPPQIWERDPPIRFRKNIPTVWLEMTLQEGKNRQVRKMTAGVGHPTLRLIRYSIEGLNIDKMQIGEVIEINPKNIYKKLNISR